ncbi:phytoene desaturase family protein [Microscilla marina]|uniref:Lipoprotein, putative n=1 Tax=Microscilla marina ATCC 23134 TaxID=313606 RepID=A1ZQ83_MICM2|nr:NAD(P)/FAD-dependent oxidoreductase [Microscilla marina]EAY27492.1 lipoprotein, putative [Microscilla marina ATCC 23134]
MKSTHHQAIIVGSGMGALTTACLLAQQGLNCLVLEQNYLPGGCTSSYWRKGFVFESGATTLVGLDPHMPLQYLLNQTGIKLNTIHLSLPMQVHLKDQQVAQRYQSLDAWITEAERVFGKKNQRKFWEFCYKVSQFVWKTSLRQTAFPPTQLADWWQCIRNASVQQVNYARYAFFSMQWLLKKFDLLDNQLFVNFVDEQLLITAQNYHPEVNVLFGATALCYTNYKNYYMPGGLINLVNPLIEYLEQHGSEVILRNGVQQIEYNTVNQQYNITAKKGNYTCDFLISGVPLNNTVQLYKNAVKPTLKHKVLPSEKLNSAFQMGIGFTPGKHTPQNCIHHQIHLPKPLPEVGSHSIFVSLSHPKDPSRCDTKGQMVASISTHIAHPAQNTNINKDLVEQVILDTLEQKGFLAKEDIIYSHSSTQKSWQKWTGRAYGFVGGYPQYMNTKPWQMVGARLDQHKAYLCGDTAYPGQGIPGAVLSGIIAFDKLKRDWL